ncbi:hypothetical protein J0H58_26065 [bacterium]|nr:hypothetical protein [bacterium]
MTTLEPTLSAHRRLVEHGLERRDELGFLDLGRTPRAIEVAALEGFPATLITAPPWLGKTTVARGLYDWLRRNSTAFGGLEGRAALTELGRPGAEREIPPAWWVRWVAEEATPAAWILDGLDEGADLNDRLLADLLAALEAVPEAHRNLLRLVMLTREHPRLDEVRGRLRRIYPPYSGRMLRELALARVDPGYAEALVGVADFSRVAETIRKNQLESVAGYPVVLGFLKRHPAVARLTTAEVWRGVLLELLGQTQRDHGRPFLTEPEDRFDAACRAAAMLTLIRRDTLREYSPDPAEPTIGSLFGVEFGSNRLRLAAREVLRTAAFHALAEEGAYRFTHRNIQDWFAAFSLASLPARALTTAVGDTFGRVHSRLRETARLVRVISSDGAVHTAIDRLTGSALPSDATEPSLARALTHLDRLEVLARASEWGLRLDEEMEEGLARLAVPGMAAEVAGRLGDPTRPATVKRFLLNVADAVQAVEAIAPAARLVLDGRGNDDLRVEAAMFVCRFGGSNELRSLEASVAENPGVTDPDERVRGILIYELLDRGLWTVARAVRHAPAVSARILDRRAMLHHRLEERLTVDDAREVLPHFRALLTRHGGRRPNRLPRLLDRAISLVRDQEQLEPGDVELLERLAVEMLGSSEYWTHALTIANRLRGIAPVRRRLYHFDAERVLRGEDSTTIGRRALEPEDWEWLSVRARGEYAAVPDIWWDVYYLAERARSAGQVPAPIWETLVQEVEGHVPGLQDQVAAGRRRHAEQEARWRAEQEERDAHEPDERPLSEVVRAVLDQKGVTNAWRMTELGILCFFSEVRPDHITGDWDDLPAALQAEALAACRNGLETGQPGPRAPGNTLNGRTLGEAAAFDRLARSEEADRWLSDELVRRWLPVALHGLGSASWPDLIRTCWSASRPSTEQALAETAADQTGRYEQPSNLRMVPAECWAGPLTEQVASLLGDDGLGPRARRELLEVLASREPDRALSRAQEWARRPRTDQADDHLRQGGLNVLLCLEPATGLWLVEQQLSARGSACLEELHGLSAGRSELRADWERWPLDSQERLAALLIRAFPHADEDDEDDSDWRGDDLRILRTTVVHRLVQGPEAEHRAAADRLAALDPGVRRLVDAHRASAAAAQELAVAEPTAATDPAAISLPVARCLLDRRAFRLIRSADDLLDAVLFALDEVQQEVGHDLPLLYGPPEDPPPAKATGAKAAKAIESERKHLREDALQAYLRRRLKDVLSRVAERVEVQIGREEQVAYRRRFDLRVTAPCLGTQKLATVVVEIKWSTNPETSSSLVDQLGEKYLIHEGHTHGVFLVGWSGWWRPGGRQRKGTDITKLREFLCSQRDAFCSPGQRGEQVRIEPVAIDLGWRPAAPIKSATGGITPATRSSSKRKRK